MFTYFKSQKEIKLQHTLQSLARKMCKNPTVAERILWQHLKNRRFRNFKFRRQHPLFKFIVDFYCHKYKFIIEVDGGIHQHQLIYEGFIILRFNNDDIIYNIKTVLTKIEHILKSLS